MRLASFRSAVRLALCQNTRSRSGLAAVSSSEAPATGNSEGAGCRPVASKGGSSGARVLDGRKAAERWNQELKQAAREVTEKLGRKPALSVVVVGSRPDSLLYVEKKEEACYETGITPTIHHIQEFVTQEELENTVRRICGDPKVDGVLVQLPLPAHLDEEAIMEAFDPWKDVDGFHALNMGHMLMRGRSPRFVPCTALGCMNLLQQNNIDLASKTAVVVGDSNIVGTPLSILLRNRGAAIVTVCHGTSYKKIYQDKEGTQDWRAAAEACNPVLPGPAGRWSVEHAIKRLPGTMICDPITPGAVQRMAEHFHIAQLANITRTADILIVAVGHPELVKADWVKPGAVVLDVGINVISRGIPQAGSSLEDGSFHIVGDVSFRDVSQVASAITPVPGGIGPMTISAVMHNTILAAWHVVRGS